MDQRSESNLDGVHPDLAKVIRAASDAGNEFIVIHGLRTAAVEKVLVSEKHSTTMHSRHLANKKGEGCAVDIMATPGGHASWAPGDYQPLAEAIKSEGVKLGIPVEWGGDWTSFKDLGHFQLPWKLYP